MSSLGFAGSPISAAPGLGRDARRALRHVLSLRAGALLLAAAAVGAMPQSAAAVTVAGPGRTTINTSDMICTTILNVAFASTSQTIQVLHPGVTSTTTMPSSRARWTAYLQWSPATGTPRWQNWVSKSLIANVSGFPGALYIPFNNMTWNLNVPQNTYQFRVQHKIEFLDPAGTPVASSNWILGDNMSTRVWITGLGLGNDVDTIAWGRCQF